MALWVASWLRRAVLCSPQIAVALVASAFSPLLRCRVGRSEPRAEVALTGVDPFLFAGIRLLGPLGTLVADRAEQRLASE